MTFYNPFLRSNSAELSERWSIGSFSLTIEVAPDPPGSLALDDPQIRIDYYTALIDQQLAAIDRLQAHKLALTELIDRVNEQWTRATAPIEDQILDRDMAIHHLFELALARPKLGKKSRRQLERHYERLQGSLISPRRRTETAEQDPPVYAEEESGAEQHREQRVSRADVINPIADPDTKSRLRLLYLELAAAFHPDLHPGSSYHQEMMQQINAAYESGDIQTLLRIRQGLGSVGNDSSADLISHHQSLSTQVIQLRRLIDRLNNCRGVHMAADIARGLDPIGEIAGELIAQLASMEPPQQLLERFVKKRVGILEFLSQLEQVENPQ